MRALLAIALLLAACGDDDDDAPRPPCALEANDLLAPTESNLPCIRTLFATEPTRAAALLGKLDWVQWKETTHKLKPLPVESRWWYVIALQRETLPRVALSALQLARSTTDQVFVADIDLAVIDIARRANDESTANTAIEQLLTNTAKLGVQKRELLAILSKRREQKRIEQICRTENEAAIAWRCLELAPSLPESLAGCGRLPVLSFKDIEKFKPLQTKLVGLRCKTEGPRGIRSVFGRVANQGTSTPEEVTIYSRLTLDAPQDSEKCFLEEAAYGCLALIRRGDACPVLDSVARYVAVVADEDRMAAFQAVFEGKNLEYDLLYNGSPQAGANLFHLHMLLGEMLVANNLFPNPSQAFQAPYYHVIRAWRFWADVKDPVVKFVDMFSPKLTETFCADTKCELTCRLPWHGEPNNCREACQTVRTKLSCPGG